ncbi:DUF2254 domain-containing protein [uncultured Pontibacter sp.]|uniref:DUF2254 domain-containing protein n=1 Tax=uncultured Pontibacter sp. TaxID=453356 RepID=UPI002639BAB3|nr:DUF2254 domain-containing protein [uncultured Pontibacter sp.]
MAKLTTKTYRAHATIVNSIAFLPSLISTGFFLLALYMQYFESTPLSKAMEDKLPFGNLQDEENARLILNTLAGGTISLTVFSFSMVMIVLNQASSNLSPRVIPGLTTARSHQVVLGFYIGTIIYILLLLLHYQPQASNAKTPVLAILLGLVFGIICLVLFVYFIHTISRAIQVDNILNSLFQKAVVALQKEADAFMQTYTSFNTNGEAFKYKLRNNQSGYLKQVNMTGLQQIAKKNGMQLEILVEVGSFIVEGIPLMRLTKEVTEDNETEEKLQQCFIISQEEVVMEDYEQAVKQISEIAVKALSPGINDPGTAIKAIDFLTLLFIHRLKLKDRNCLLHEEERVQVIDRIVTLDELLHRYLSPIRTYGKGDFQINIRLLRCLQGLLYQQPSDEQLNFIRAHALAVVSDAHRAIENEVDRNKINEHIQEFNTLLPDRLKLGLLKVDITSNTATA